MELALVRHGQTDWNALGRFQGTSDTPLNDTGLDQAREAAKLLAAEPWEEVVSSPLQRAAVTADVIAAELGIKVVARFESLIERAYGPIEGLTRAEADAKFGKPWPGVESFEDLTTRAVAAIDSVAGGRGAEWLVIVSHGTFIRAFSDSVTGLATETPQNAHAVRFSGEPGAWEAGAGLVLR